MVEMNKDEMLATSFKQFTEMSIYCRHFQNITMKIEDYCIEKSNEIGEMLKKEVVTREDAIKIEAILEVLNDLRDILAGK